MHPIDSTHLRLIWRIIEAHGYLLKGLNDEALCSWVIKNLKEKIHISHEDLGLVQQYVYNRTQLIRDFVETQAM